MITLTNQIANCQYTETNDGRCFIEINGQFFLWVGIGTTEDYSFLERMFNKWVGYNYPSFWKNPIRYLFGGELCYDCAKIL